MPRFNRFGAASALAAALSLVTTPAFAVELPHTGRVAVHAADDSAAMARRGHWTRRHHHGGVDGGDILAGVLILGGIAAVASAVGNNNDRNDDYRNYPPPPPRSQGRYDYRNGPAGSSGGLDRAANICTDAIERTIDPVASVDSVRRGPSGWDVDGSLQDGSPFTCSIGNDGQIRDIQTDRSYSGAAYNGAPSYDDPGYDDQSYQGSQYDDETYARLRESREGVGG